MKRPKKPSLKQMVDAQRMQVDAFEQELYKFRWAKVQRNMTRLPRQGYALQRSAPDMTGELKDYRSTPADHGMVREEES